MAAGGTLLSAASWRVTSERMGGTLLQRLHGWPKVYSFECISPECDGRGPSFSLLFFLGNSFVHAAGLILCWTAVAILAALLRGGEPPSP